MNTNATVAAPQNTVVKILPNDKGNPPGKLADAEIHFVDGVFAGLKLIGFSIWERRTGGGRNVTFPARQYSGRTSCCRRTATSCCAFLPRT